MFCKRCGKEINKESSFCKYCGQDFKEPVTDIKKTQVNTPQEKETQSIIPNKPFGKFWPRAGAFIIDLLIIYIILVVYYIFFGYLSENFDSFIWVGIFTVYHIFCLSIYSSTPGKMIYGLRVLDDKSENKITFSKALIRSLSYYVSFFIVGIGFIKIAIDKNKHKAVHDDIAKTVVVQKKYNKAVAIILTVVSTIFYLYIFGSYSEDIEEPINIRNETREIRNQLNINDSLFKTDEENQESGNINEMPNITDREGAFDVNKEISAVVLIECPDDEENINSSGSGTIIDETGIILTNYHVKEDSNLYMCKIGITNDISQEPVFMYYASDILGSEEDGFFKVEDSSLDFSLLFIDSAIEGYKLPEKFPSVSKIGSSDALNINDKVYVVGYPSYGANTITYTEGVVSGRVGSDLIKTSAKIDFGNSGGAVFNQAGEYVGMPTYIFSGGLEGLGYIVGIDSVMYYLNQGGDIE